MDEVRLPVGARIKYYRHRNGNRSQAAIAGLSGITERYLQQIEAGQKTPSASVLARIATELRVPVAALLSEATVVESSTPMTASPDVVLALMGLGPPRNPQPEAVEQLRGRVERAWWSWQSSKERFTVASTTLPGLVSDVEHAVRARRAGNDAAAARETYRVAADLYGLLRSYFRRVGRPDLALLVADRAIRAAEEADDPVRIAAGRWNLGHALLSQADKAMAEEAKEVALVAAEQLREVPRMRDAKAVEGSLELVVVVSDARCQRWSEARERLEQRAAPLAREVGDGNVQWTVFGPTNVDLHALSIEMLAGEAAEGMRRAERIDVSHLPSRERQFTFALELARCYDLRREDAAVLVQMLGLEEIAPEDLARSPLGREIVLNLVQRARPTFRRQAIGLAERLQLM